VKRDRVIRALPAFVNKEAKGDKEGLLKIQFPLIKNNILSLLSFQIFPLN
jgi:hypothetical protein